MAGAPYPRSARATILVIEDDPEIAATEKDLLEAAGFRIRTAGSGAEARAAVEQAHPDLILLDLLLPDVDGLVMCSNLKSMSEVPIIIVSGTQRRWDAILGLKLGADDFIAKPFDNEDLIARVEAVLRRVSSARTPQAAAPTGQGELHVGDLVLNPARRQAALAGQSLQLTPAEFGLLTALASRPNTIMARDELAQAAWGRQDSSSGRTVDAHIRRLRVKMSGVQGTPNPAILSVRGFGYKLAPAERGQVKAVA